MRNLRLVSFFLLVTICSLFTLSNSANALSGSEFQSGRIMDDSVFFNGNALNTGDIQAFLNAKVPTCDTNGSQPYGGTTRGSYGASRGYPPPYTCLKDYRQDVPAKAVESGLCNGFSAGNKSSAQIIFEVGQSCGVSQKVLIELLEKEQSLVTDDWPWWIQYRSATGYGCPDTAPCDAEYYGYFNQVYNAARQYKRYARDASLFSYRAFRVNSIQYNPNAGCGAGNVYIQNQTTAGLYNYTPYQPNTAALVNLYGSGDACSAYGNRNFWRLYNDWFGNTFGAAYYTGYENQSAYPIIDPGSQSAAFISYKNRGSVTWYDSTSLAQAPAGTKPVHLSTSHLLNRSGIFSATWPTPSRPALNFSAVYEADGTTLAGNQHVAQPGQIVKFAFTFSVPSGQAAGTYSEYFQPIVEGSSDGAFNDPWTRLDVAVAAKPAVIWHSQSTYPVINPTEKVNSYMRFKNSGNSVLYDDTSIGSAPAGNYPVHLATASPLNRSSAFSSGWPTPSRPALNFSAVYEADGTTLAGNQHVAQPGQIVKFDFSLSAPEAYATSTYREFLRPIMEGTSDGYLPDQGAFTDITVPQTAVITYSQPTPSLQLTANQPGNFNVTIKNSGNTTLASDTKIYSSNGQGFRSSTWINDNIITSNIGANLASLATRTITIPVLAPGNSNSSNSSMNIEFQTSSNTRIPLSNLTIPVAITPAAYTLTYYSQSAYPSLAHNQTKTIFLQYKNTGNQTWYDDNGLASVTTRSPQVVHLSTASPLNHTSSFARDWPTSNRPAVNFAAVYEVDGTTLAGNQHVAQPGQIVKFVFNVSSVSTSVSPGSYREFFQPIIEGSYDGVFNFAWTFQDIQLIAPTYNAAYKAQSSYPTIAHGSTASAFLSYQNNGTTPWFDDVSLSQAIPGTKPVHLSTAHGLNRLSQFSHSTWAGPNRPATTFAAVYEADGTTLAVGSQHIAQPGQIVKFVFTLNVPGNIGVGNYREFFQPIIEGSYDGSFNDTWTFLDITVN